jgi:hypothetical protein
MKEEVRRYLSGEHYQYEQTTNGVAPAIAWLFVRAMVARESLDGEAVFLAALCLSFALILALILMRRVRRGRI